MEELKKTIALLFKRKGGSQMTEKEFVFSASMDLRWFPPKDSQKLLEVAIARGMVNLTDGEVSPGFDISTVEIPLDFTPTPAVFDMPVKEDLFSKVLDHVLATGDIDRKEAISRINALQEKMEVDIEVAALLIGQELDVDMSGFISEVEKDILKRMNAGN
jgi:hypothetical protein